MTRWASRCLVVLGFLSLLVPATAAASGRAPVKRQVKSKTAANAKRSREKLAVGKAKQKNATGKGTPKAAGFLPRPAGGGKAAGAQPLAGTRTASVAKTTTRARSTARRTTMTKSKTRTARKTRRTTPKKRRAARTTQRRSRSSQQMDTGGEAADLAAAGMDADGMAPGHDVDAQEMGDGRPQSRFRRILRGTGRVLKSAAKYAGYGLVVAAPMAVMAVGGLPIAFAIGAPAIFLGIPMAIGLIEQRAKQNQGIDDPQGELLQRYMSRQMLENQDLNGPGPGNGVAGVGGLNTLNNMIDPGGMR